MDVPALLERMRRFPDSLEGLLAYLPIVDWRWRPPEGGWSILEIVNHLDDEEHNDFRARLRSTIEDPSRPWAPMDPQGSVLAGRFQQRDHVESLRRFRAARQQSLAWLRTVAGDPWDRAYQHPRVGPIRAGDLLAAWAAHDARHLAQIAKRLHALAARDGAPYSVAYAD